MYDPATAQFLRPDPLWPLTGQANAYAYCGNDPINRVDPSGLADKPSVSVSILEPNQVSKQMAGIGITVTTSDRTQKVSFLQFAKIHAVATCTYFNTCKQESSYITYTHSHGGGAAIEISKPDKPIWNIDHGTSLTPEYPLVFDLTPANSSAGIHRLEDWPIITSEVEKEVLDSPTLKKVIEIMEQRRPNDGKVSCDVSVKAHFLTYVIVDGQIISRVIWSTGAGFYPTVGQPSDDPASPLRTDKWPAYPDEKATDLLEQLLKKVKSEFPNYTLPTIRKP